MIGRAVVAVLLAGRATDGLGATPVEAAAAPRHVVFVCEHGSAKSLLAASYFDRLAKDRGLAVRAVSRGTVPDAAVPAGVAQGLREAGFDVSSMRPQRLRRADLAGAARVVAFGVDVSAVVGVSGVRVERWDDVPAVSVSFAAARDAIVARVLSLIAEVEREPERPSRP